MILGFKEKFNDGTPTNFTEMITNSFFINTEDFSEWTTPKLHSIRAGHRWRKGMKIHFATGVRTKKYDNWATGVCKGVQDIEIKWGHPNEDPSLYIDNVAAVEFEGEDFIEEIAENDGLTKAQFLDWFYAAASDDNGKRTFKGQIIHWTDLTY